MADDEAEVPLAELFASGAAKREAAATASEAEAALRRCAATAAALGLFSRNEEANDVATADLRYLLVPAYLADALQAAPCDLRDPAAAPQRAAALRRASAELAAFLQRLDDYGLLPEIVAKARDRDGPPDPQKAREDKVAAFRRGRELAARAAQLEERVAKVAGTADADEDEERELWLLRIEQEAYKAHAAGDTIERELEMLAIRVTQGPAPERPEPPRRGPPQPGNITHIPAPGAAPIELGSLREAVQVEAQRQRLREGVFRPGHNLPTYTVEQWGAIEYREMMEKQAEKEEAERQKAIEWKRAEENGQRTVESDDDEEKTLKDRNWDDWKDDNPRGSGNSRLRPLGS